MENRINLAGASQQHVQRLEAARIAPRLELAARLAEILDVSVSALFPGSAQALRAMKKEREDEPGYLTSDKNYGRIAAIGIEVDSRHRIFRVQLRGQLDVIYFYVEQEEKRRLFHLQSESRTDEELSFAVFDTEHERVGLNVVHCLYCHFIHEARELIANEEDSVDDAKVYLANS